MSRPVMQLQRDGAGFKPKEESRRAILLKDMSIALVSVVQLVGASSHKLKGCGFDSLSGHTPGLLAALVSGGGAYERQLMDVSLLH